MEYLAQNSPTQKSSSSSSQRPRSGTVMRTQSPAGGGHYGGSAENSIKNPVLQVVEVSNAAEGRRSSFAVALGVAKGGSGSRVEKPRVQMRVKDPCRAAKQSNKRKPSDLTNPPSGMHTCRICQREFASQMALNGHMRVHSEHKHHGILRHPVISSKSPSPALPAPAPEAVKLQGDSGRGVAAGPSGITFDLNQPMEGVESNAEEKSDEGKKFDFDLNEPYAEDDEDKP